MSTLRSSGVVATVSTPDGPFTVLEDVEHRVLASGWTADAALVVSRVAAQYRPAQIVHGSVRSAESVDAYYAGDADQILRVPVRQFGTELFMEGWRRLRDIPTGDTVTYTEFATALGRPAAVRAAASVCARNAPALFVPCHRVLRSDGTLGGFAWGTDIKRALLEREAVGVTTLA